MRGHARFTKPRGDPVGEKCPDSPPDSGELEKSGQLSDREERERKFGEHRTRSKGAGWLATKAEQYGRQRGNSKWRRYFCQRCDFVLTWGPTVANVLKQSKAETFLDVYGSCIHGGFDSVDYNCTRYFVFIGKRVAFGSVCE